MALLGLLLWKGYFQSSLELMLDCCSYQQRSWLSRSRLAGQLELKGQLNSALGLTWKRMCRGNASCEVRHPHWSWLIRQEFPSTPYSFPRNFPKTLGGRDRGIPERGRLCSDPWHLSSCLVGPSCQTEDSHLQTRSPKVTSGGFFRCLTLSL